MLHENEIVMLLLGIIIFFFILRNKTQIRRIYAWRLLITSYFLLLAGWIFTIVEGFVLETALNMIEHLSYTISAILLAFWCWKVMYRSKVEG
jgi:hypothetical protein